MIESAPGSASALAGAGPDPDLVRRIRNKVVDALAAQTPEHMSPIDREMLGAELISQALEENAAACLARGEPSPDAAEEAAVSEAVRDLVFRHGRLSPLLADDSITDIHIVGSQRTILDLADGSRAELGPIADSEEELIELVRGFGRTEGLSERRFDHAHPWISLQLNDGSRLSAVNWVTDVCHVFIRRHRFLEVTLEDLVRLRTMVSSLAAFLAAAVAGRLNMLVVGGPGVGKTTLLRGLLAAVGEVAYDGRRERLTTVEAQKELSLGQFPKRYPDGIALEAREGNTEGAGAIGCAELVMWANRMNSTRIAVGEILDPDVVLPMLNAMNSGQAGSFCTLHANSSADALEKLAVLALQGERRMEIADTYALAAKVLDLVIFMERVGAERRVVASVREVTGFDGHQVTTNEIWALGPDGLAQRTPVALTESTRNALARVGYQEEL